MPALRQRMLLGLGHHFGSATWQRSHAAHNCGCTLLIMGPRLHAVAVLSQTLQAIRSFPQLRFSERLRKHQAVLTHLGVSSPTDQFVGLFLIATHCISSIHLDHYDFFCLAHAGGSPDMREQVPQKLVFHQKATTSPVRISFSPRGKTSPVRSSFPQRGNHSCAD